MRLAFLFALLLLCIDPARAAESAETIVRDSLDRLGGGDRLRSAPFDLVLVGTQDLAAAMQGRHPDRAEPVPISERVTVDLAGRRAGYEVHRYNYHLSRQHLRELRLPGGRVAFIDMRSRQGGWPPFEFAADGHLRTARALPQVLLIDALDNRDSLRLDGAHGRNRRLSYRTSAGDRIEFAVNRSSGDLLWAESAVEIPLKGETRIRWTWSGYRRANGMRLPARFETWIGDRRYKTQQASLHLESGPGLLEPPPGVDLAEPPGLGKLRPWVPFGQRKAQVESPFPGVHVVRNLRPGFHVMAVEFGDHLVVIDAPAGWVELDQIPPYDDSRGGGAGELGEKLAKALASVSAKPVRYVALTHHHFDHVGGVRPLAERGATIVGADPAVREVERYVGRDLPDVRVNDRWVHSDDSMELHLVRLPDGNPKADGFLVAYLPRLKAAYVTGFFYPVDEGSKQPPESIPLATWFIDWLDRSGLEVEHLFNLHATGRLQSWQWQELRALGAAPRPAGD